MSSTTPTVTNAERLTRRVNDDSTSENWAPHARSIFDAAENGSKLAAAVIDDGQVTLPLIGQLRRAMQLAVTWSWQEG